MSHLSISSSFPFLALLASTLSLLASLASATTTTAPLKLNDWSVPCFQGRCAYDLPDADNSTGSAGGVSGSLQIVRRPLQTISLRKGSGLIIEISYSPSCRVLATTCIVGLHDGHIRYNLLGRVAPSLLQFFLLPPPPHPFRHLHPVRRTRRQHKHRSMCGSCAVVRI